MATFDFYAGPQYAFGNALLNWTPRALEDLVAYAVSYRNAAHTLVAFQEQRGIGSINHAACPIVFLYRHSLELYLKAMIFRAARLTIDEGELTRILPRLWKEHSLVRLLEMATPVLRALDSYIPVGLRGVHEKVLDLATRIDEVDPGSYSFRYPVTPSGTSSLPTHLMVSIFVFAEHADAALDDLNTLCIYLRESLAASAQMRLALAPIRESARDAT